MKLRFSVLAVLLAALTLFVGCGPTKPAQVPYPYAANRPKAPSKPIDLVDEKIGFTSKAALDEHFNKHGKEFGDISKDEYLHRAQVLRDGILSKDVVQFRRADNVITKFDRKSGGFIAFNRDLTIRTFFKPNDGERYFNRQKTRRN